jgi:hypothetical protein
MTNHSETKPASGGIPARLKQPIIKKRRAIGTFLAAELSVSRSVELPANSIRDADPNKSDLPNV